MTDEIKRHKVERQIIITNRNPTKINVDTEFDETFNMWRVKVRLKNKKIKEQKE